jgi:hypothetical protein
MALRALTEICPTLPAIDEASEWLLRARNPSSLAWGEQVEGEATVTHTAFALATLAEAATVSPRPNVKLAISSGFAWLEQHARTDALFDENARVESYNVSYELAGERVVWQNSVWHPSLPYALAALVRHPDGPDPDQVGSAVNRIVIAQGPDGRWPNVDGSAEISIWSVWPFLDALSDFMSAEVLQPADEVTWISRDTVLVRRGDDAKRPIRRVAWTMVSSAALRTAKRHWATLILLAVLMVGAVLSVFGVLGVEEFALALLFPVALTFYQEIRARGR